MAKTKNGAANPFLDAKFGEVMDFGKFAEQFRFPGVDSKAVVECQKRNLETVAAANKVAFEGLQALLQRQAEILRQGMEEANKVLAELAKPGKPEEKMVKQTELMKQSYELALANLQELTDMGTKSNREVAELFNHRVADSFDEIRGAIKQVAAAK